MTTFDIRVASRDAEILRTSIRRDLGYASAQLFLHDESSANATLTRAQWVTYLEDLASMYNLADNAIITATYPTEPS